MTDDTGTLAIATIDTFHLFTPGLLPGEDPVAKVVLDLETERLWAWAWHRSETAVPMREWHGYQQTWTIPALSGKAAEELLDELAPYAERMIADWHEEWDGNNHRAVLGEDAHAAAGAIDSITSALTEDPYSLDVVSELTLDSFDVTVETWFKDLQDSDPDLSLSADRARIEAAVLGAVDKYRIAVEGTLYADLDSLTDDAVESRDLMRREILDELEEATSELTEARATWESRIKQARDAGSPLRDIADAAGITHTAVRKIVDRLADNS